MEKNNGIIYLRHAFKEIDYKWLICLLMFIIGLIGVMILIFFIQKTGIEIDKYVKYGLLASCFLILLKAIFSLKKGYIKKKAEKISSSSYHLVDTSKKELVSFFYYGKELTKFRKTFWAFDFVWEIDVNQTKPDFGELTVVFARAVGNNLYTKTVELNHSDVVNVIEPLRSLMREK